MQGVRTPSILPNGVSATPTPEASQAIIFAYARSERDTTMPVIATIANATATASRTPTEGPLSTTPFPKPTAFPSWSYSRPRADLHTTTAPDPPGLAMFANRPEEWQYGQLSEGSVLIHYQLAFAWTHGPGSLQPTPVPPGTDVSDRCVLHRVLGWVTDDPADCPALFPGYMLRDTNFMGMIWREGALSLDEACNAYDREQRSILEPYFDMPDCWIDEWEKKTIFHFAEDSSTPSGPGPSDAPAATSSAVTVLTTTGVVTASNSQLITIAGHTTPGSDVITISLDPSHIITTTRRRGEYDNPIPGVVTTATDALGQPTATTTSFPTDFSLRRIPSTLRNPLGMPTATIWEYESLSSSLVTLADERGAPVLTLTEYIRPRPTSTLFPATPGPHRAPDGVSIYLGPLSRTGYFMGSFAPVLFTTSLTVLV